MDADQIRPSLEPFQKTSVAPLAAAVALGGPPSGPMPRLAGLFHVPPSARVTYQRRRSVPIQNASTVPGDDSTGEGQEARLPPRRCAPLQPCARLYSPSHRWLSTAPLPNISLLPFAR